MLVLIRTELIKLTTSRAPWLLAGGAVALTTILALQAVLRAGLNGAPSIGTAGATLAVVDALGRGALVALVVGVLVVTTEFRYHTITSTLLQVPGRVRLGIAKGVAAAAVGLALGIVGLLVVTAVGVGSAAMTADLLNVDIALRAAGLVATYPLYALLGVAVGALLSRSQPLAVILPLAWLLGLEALVLNLLPTSVLPWSWGATAAALQNAGNVDAILPVWLGTVTILAYVLALFAAGTARISRNDIT